MARTTPSDTPRAARSARASVLATFTRPGRRLMSNLRMPAKLSMVAASVVLPLCLVMAMSIHELVGDWRYAASEFEALDITERVTQVVEQAQLHRGLGGLVAAGDESARAPMEEAARHLHEAVADLDASISRTAHFRLDDLWTPLRATLLGLANQPPPDAPDPFAQHTTAIEALRQLMLAGAERSGFVLDPQAQSYFQMDVLVNSVLPVAEAAARAGGQGATLLRRGQASAAERADVLAQAALLERGTLDLGGKFAAMERAGGQIPGSWPQTRQELDHFARGTRALFTAPTLDGNAAELFRSRTMTVARLVAMQGDVATRLRAVLKARQQSIARNIGLMVGAFAFGMLSLTYLLASFAMSFRASLRALQRCTEAVAEGDLSQRLEVEGRDELADIGVVMDRMAQRLSNLVSEIRNSASLVNMTGQQVSDGSARLAARTDEQAASVGISVGAIGELTQSVERNVDATRDLDALTGKLATQAELGSTAMGETVQAMQQMQEASQRVAEVIGVIDDVAFQTGMLALNAAVEAARAGSAGKGFAVVASEVRQLAQRCAESADEIRALIGNASDQVLISGEKLQNVSGSLGTIFDGVGQVSSQLRAITEACQAQSAGLMQVTSSVGNLDDITRQNAALVEESNTASNALVDRATKLREAVASMKLRQGSAEEAVALVERALARIAEVGREQALAEIHDPGGEFIDRDLYIFGVNRQGAYSANGAWPQLVGESVQNMPGIPPRFTELAWAKAEAGGGWLAYETLNPDTQQMMTKESYLRDDGDGNVIGCGIYRNDLGGNETARPRAAAWDRSLERQS